MFGNRSMRSSTLTLELDVVVVLLERSLVGEYSVPSV